MDILGVITARGGSKRIPRKNLRLLRGKPLIQYTVEAALQSKLLTRVVVSSEDEEIMGLSRRLGAEVPFRRPEELATDEATSVAVLVHAVDFMEKQGFHPEIVVLLEPTSPLRLAEDIDNALRKHIETGADTVVSVTMTDHWHPIRAKKIEDDVLYDYCLEEKEVRRRQDLRPAYFRNGCYYSVKRDILMNEHKLYGKTVRPYIMPHERSIEIDEEIHFKLAELLLSEREDERKE